MASNYKVGVVIDAKGASGAASDLGKVDSKLNQFGQTAKNAFASFTGNLAADAFAKITALAYDGGKAVFDYSEKIAATKIGLESLTGSAGKAQIIFKEIESLSKNTPFVFGDLAGAAQRLLGANVELKKVVPLMKDIGNVVSATGAATKERFEGITTAITQIIAKGKVSAEEMEQLAERGVPAWNILSQSIGLTVAQTRKLAEDGKITSDVMVRALQRISSEKYGDAMAKQSQLASVSIAKITNDVIKATSDALQPFFKEVAGFAARFRKEIEAQKGDLAKIGEVFVKYFAEGLGKAITVAAEYYGKAFVKRFKEITTEGRLIEPIAENFITSFWVGILKGFGANADKIEQFRNKMRYAFSFSLLKGQSYAEFVKQNIAPDSSGYTVPKTPNYTRPYDNPDYLAKQKEQAEFQKLAADNQSKELEKQRKEREAAFKKQQADLEKYKQLQITTEQQAFSRIQNINDDNLAQGKIKFEDYQQATLRNLEVYKQRIGALIGESFKIASAGKSGQELLNEQTGFQNTLNAFYESVEAQKRDLTNRQNEAAQKSADEQFRISETLATRQIELNNAVSESQIARTEETLRAGLIDEKGYAESVAAIKLSMLVKEKNINLELRQGLDENADKYAEITHRIALLDEQITQQQIANAKSVIEVVNELAQAYENTRAGKDGGILSAGEFDPARGERRDPFAQWKISWREFKEEIEKSVGVKNIIAEVGQTMVNAAQSMTQAVGNAVEAWALYGDSIGTALKKALAAELAHIAGIATVNALYATALGFMRLAMWDFAGAANAFISAGIWAAIAGGTAIAAKAVAGDSFKNQGQSNSQTNQPNYYTANPNTNIQTSSNGGVADGLRSDLSTLSDSVGMLHDKISSMSPGAVLTVGAKEKRGFISETMVNELNSNGSKATQMGRALRLG